MQQHQHNVWCIPWGPGEAPASPPGLHGSAFLYCWIWSGRSRPRRALACVVPSKTPIPSSNLPCFLTHHCSVSPIPSYTPPVPNLPPTLCTDLLVLVICWDVELDIHHLLWWPDCALWCVSLCNSQKAPSTTETLIPAAPGTRRTGATI